MKDFAEKLLAILLLSASSFDIHAGCIETGRYVVSRAVIDAEYSDRLKICAATAIAKGGTEFDCPMYGILSVVQNGRRDDVKHLTAKQLRHYGLNPNDFAREVACWPD